MKKSLLRQRRFVTLIEVVIVMAILSLMAGIIGVNISKAMQEQKFRTEVGLVIERLRLAQNLMLILGEDVKVYFKKVENGISVELALQCSTNKGWGKELTRKQILTAVRQVDFKGEREDLGRDEFGLDFMSGGVSMSRGILKLSTGKNRLYVDRRYLCLPGYPAPFVAMEKKPDLSCLAGFSQDESLTQFIMPEILPKFESRAAKKRSGPEQ